MKTTNLPEQQVLESRTPGKYSVPVPGKPMESQIVDNPFYISSGNFTSADWDTLNSIADSGGGVLLLTPDIQSRLTSFYGKVPGLQEYVEGRVNKFNELLQDPRAKQYNDLGHNFLYNSKLGADSMKYPTIGSTQLKKMATSSLPKSNIDITQQPGYVSDLSSYNKKLREQQGI